MVYRAGSAETLDDLWILSLEGELNPRPLVATRFIERNAEISPDGRWLTYQSNESGGFEIYVRPFPDVDKAVWLVSDAGGTKPLWHPDGGSLYYLEPGPAIVRVEVEDGAEFVAGSRDNLGGSEFYFGAQGRNMDIHPDGRFLVLDQSSKVGEPAGIVLVDGWLSELDRLAPRK